MLDLGFIEDVEKILRMCPSGRQTALFSATMPPPIARLAEALHVRPGDDQGDARSSSPSTRSSRPTSRSSRARRPTRLIEVLKAEEPEQAIIFCRTKIGAARLDQTLARPRPRVKALHGDMSQGQRDGVMIAVQGAPGAAAGRHRRRRPRARHRARHPRDQLRPAQQHRDLRAPDRPHRPGRAHRPRDHLRDPEAARRDRPDRARGEDLDRRVGAARGAARARAAAAPPRPRRRARSEARAPASAGSSPSPTPRTGRPRATPGT